MGRARTPVHMFVNDNVMFYLFNIVHHLDVIHPMLYCRRAFLRNGGQRPRRRATRTRAPPHGTTASAVSSQKQSVDNLVARKPHGCLTS
jgi:hypothetical protein